jgi:hypothetical protein
MSKIRVILSIPVYLITAAFAAVGYGCMAIAAGLSVIGDIISGDYYV